MRRCPICKDEIEDYEDVCLACRIELGGEVSEEELGYKKNYKVIAWCNDGEPSEFVAEYSANNKKEVEELFFKEYDKKFNSIDDIIEIIF